MGKSQSKTLGSLVTTLDLDERPKDKTGPVLFCARSSSLNSISTAVSFGSEGHFLAHSNSMDNLLHKKQSKSNTVKSKCNPPSKKKKENGKVYDTLLDSASVVTAFSNYVTEKSCGRDFTQSLPDKFEGGHQVTSNACTAQHRSHSHVWNSADNSHMNEDAFSSRVVADGNFDNASITAQPHSEHQLADLAFPYLHPAIVKKLSQEEWHELVSYVCATLGQSLLSSILENIQTHSLPSPLLPPDQSNGKTRSKHNQSNSNARISGADHELDSNIATQGADDETVQNVRDMLQKLRNHYHSNKIERTSSLPPLNYDLQQTSGCTPPTDNYVGNRHKQGLESSLQSHSRNHEDSFYSKTHHAIGCTKDDDIFDSHDAVADFARPQKPKKDKKNSRCTCEHSRYHCKKRRGRSKSDRLRNQNTLVDTSLDDDCPGVLENRIRRPRYHHHHHQHHVCKQCVEDSGGSRGRGSGRGHHSPDQELAHSMGEHATVGHTVVMTLEDVKMATLLLEKSTKLLDEESPDEEKQGSDENDSDHRGKLNHYPSVNDSRIAEIGVIDTSYNHSFVTSEDKSVVEQTETFGWHDFPFPSRTLTRNGRDSPATDMAVACLDMNGANMLQPLNLSEPLDVMNRGVESTINRLYLHHHYHHIIHHS